MNAWAHFWTWFLVLGLAVFFGLAIVVTIGGLYDIRALFHRLGARDGERDGSSSSSE